MTRERVVVAFVGRPNSGKSSLYNAVTGEEAKVGNFPGVTVDILTATRALPVSGVAEIADLPGFYSLDAVVDPATDEGVARRWLDDATKAGARLVIVQVLDGTQLELGLRMTEGLLARAEAVVVAVTQRDRLAADGRDVDVAVLEEALGVPVCAVSARAPAAQTRGVVFDTVERALTDQREARAKSVDARKVAARALVGEGHGRARTLTERVDAVLLHPIVGPFVFVAIMAAVFSAVFLIADPAKSVVDFLVERSREALSGALGHGLLASFVIDGLVAGTGTVVAFMPQIVILTIAMEILEATGYLARGAFIVDRLLRLLGLSGRSFAPLLVAHACAVPAIASTRIIRDPGERLRSILVLPLMTCSARIPTYGLVITAFFGGRSAFFRGGLFVLLYFAGIVAGLVASAVMRRTVVRGRGLPLVLEMPSYRAPQVRLVARRAKRAATRFVKDVGSTILAASALLWVLLTVPMPGASPAVEGTPAIERSVAAGIGRALEPVTRPIGFDWRINVGLIGSFGARELMVSTMGVIFGVERADEDPAPLAKSMQDAKKPNGEPVYGVRTGLALLAFFVLACQCMSTVAAIRRETRSLRWPAFVVGYTYALAYLVAFATYQIAGLFGAT
ncbi:MAG: ferrous iron transporter B [Myxococcales bacterium]|nr:ferrous iron transporter B [Myxococcales bacterium]